MTKPSKLLTTDDIARIQSLYPPLTEDEFRYSLVAFNVKSPDPNDPSIYMVTIVKTNADWNLLSSMTHKCYIKHRIPSIPNQAPTIYQWFHELKVFTEDLNLEQTPKFVTKSLMSIEPKSSFFENVNINFASSKNATASKRKRGKFVYYYYVEPDTNKIHHLEEPEARRLYCKKFEQSIMFPQSPARPVFERLWRTCMSRSRSIPVVLRGYAILDNLTTPTKISERYNDCYHAFGDSYCIAEMLINYPHLENCIWNREVPIKSAPVKQPIVRPIVSYTNPHNGKYGGNTFEPEIETYETHNIDESHVTEFVDDE